MSLQAQAVTNYLLSQFADPWYIAVHLLTEAQLLKFFLLCIFHCCDKDLRQTVSKENRFLVPEFPQSPSIAAVGLWHARIHSGKFVVEPSCVP